MGCDVKLQRGDPWEVCRLSHEENEDVGLCLMHVSWFFHVSG